MAHAMDPLAIQEPYFDFAASSHYEDDCSWLALEPVIDEWPGWLRTVNPECDDAAASNTSRSTSTSFPPSQPAPALLPVAPIAEEYVDLSNLTPTAAPAAANPSCHAANKGEKRLRPRELTLVLRDWLERRQAPYASLEEKKMIAEALSISVEKVTNFCNNFRKRYAKVGAKLTSYRELASAAQ